MISEAIEYPLEGDDATKTMVIGGGLHLVCGLFLAVTSLVAALLFGTLFLAPVGVVFLLVGVAPYLLLGGYSVAVSRSLMDGHGEPPQFTDWGQYARDGLFLGVIGIVYALPALVLGVVGAVLFFVTTLLPGEVAEIGTLLLGLAGLVVGGLYSLSYAYVFPVAMVNYARTGELSSAWDVGTLGAVLTDRDYAVAWALGAVALLAANSAGSSLTWILVGFLVFFYGQLVALYLFTAGVVDSLDVTSEPSGATSSTGEPAAGSAGDTADERPDEDESGRAHSDEAESAGQNETGSDEGSVADDAEGEVDGAESGEAADADERDADDAADEPTVDDRALEDVTGVGPTTAESLRTAGYETVADLRRATREELTEVDGIGPARADRMKGDVGDA